MKINALSAAVVLGMASFMARPSEAAFIPGDVVVVQDGDGTAGVTSSSNAAAVILKEFLPAGGAPVSTVAMPIAASGPNFPLTISGSATSEGFLKLSDNGQYLTMGGYGAVPGTAGVVTAAPTSVPRVVGRIDMSGNVDTTTALGDAYNGSNIRSAVSSDGTSIWTGGNAGSGQGITGGVRYMPLGSTTSTQINSTTSNMRVVNIFNGQLYVSSSSGTLLGVSTVGSGEPTTGFTGAPTALPGMPTTGTHSAYDFFFKDANTLYVADDGTAANGGGIQKWTQSAGTWSLAYTLLNTGAATTAVRGLAGTIDVGSGNAVLYATVAGSSANNLITVTDTGAGALATVLATAPASTAFRGVALIPAPAPEPGCLALVGVAVMALARRRRR